MTYGDATSTICFGAEAVTDRGHYIEDSMHEFTFPDWVVHLLQAASVLESRKADSGGNCTRSRLCFRRGARLTCRHRVIERTGSYETLP
jgi:hypothetical protein